MKRSDIKRHMGERGVFYSRYGAVDIIREGSVPGTWRVVPACTGAPTTMQSREIVEFVAERDRPRYDECDDEMVNMLVSVPRRVAKRIEACSVYTEQTPSEVVAMALGEYENTTARIEMILSDDGVPFVKPAGQPIPDLK